MWSASFSWHKSVSPLGGPMLNDTQLLSMVQRSLQRLCMFSTKYMLKVIDLIT